MMRLFTAPQRPATLVERERERVARHAPAERRTAGTLVLAAAGSAA
jgi:hypothetical protein